MVKYYKDLEDLCVFPESENGFLKNLMPSMFSDSPVSSSTLLKEYYSDLIRYTIHWQSPHFYAFFPANAIPSTVIGEMCMIGLNEINLTASDPLQLKNYDYEETVLEWIADMLDLPDCFRAKSGATACIFSAADDSFYSTALAAKNRQKQKYPDKNLVDKQVGYMSIHSNIAVERTIKYSNLNLHLVNSIGKTKIVDEFPVSTEEVEAMFEEDIAKGLYPTLYILTVGSTASLAIEDIKEVGIACKKYDVWLHIDSAQLGIYAIVPEKRFILDDCEYADSFCTNGHKSLGAGLATNFYYTKHSEFSQWVSYESKPSKDSPDLSIFDNASKRITRPTQSNIIRIAMFLLSCGREGLVGEFRRHFALADYFRELLSREESIELLETRHKLNTVLFRLKGRDNEFNAGFLDRIMESREIFLILSTVHDITFLRLSVGTFTHTRKDIEKVADHIIKIARQVKNKKKLLKRMDCARITHG